LKSKQKKPKLDLTPYKNDIRNAINRTKKNGKEVSLTYCGDTLSDFAKGTAEATEVRGCSIYDKRERKNKVILDFHTHPVTKRGTWGVTPSGADVMGTMEESYRQKQKQVSCIASPKSKNIHCFIPKKVPDKKKISKYRKGINAKGYYGKPYHYSAPDIDSTRYKDATEFDLMVKNDFEHIWIKKRDFKSIQENTKSKTSDAMDAKRFGNVDSIKHIIPDLDRSQFCNRNIQGYNDPTNHEMANDCTKRLNSRLPQDIPFISGLAHRFRSRK